jgi:hypothetical protein
VGQQVPPQVRRFQVPEKEISTEFFAQFFIFFILSLRKKQTSSEEKRKPFFYQPWSDRLCRTTQNARQRFLEKNWFGICKFKK